MVTIFPIIDIPNRITIETITTIRTIIATATDLVHRTITTIIDKIITTIIITTITETVTIITRIITVVLSRITITGVQMNNPFA